jgi:hypothetical protein
MDPWAQMMTATNPLLAAALAYASRGWRVFPLPPRGKIPAPGSHGFKDATTDLEKIERWWADNPNFNVAIATGEVSDLFVTDLDGYKYPSQTDAEEAIQPYKIPETPTVLTGAGGFQYFTKFPTGKNLTISGGKLGAFIDTRGNGGYVVAPPSIHPNGRPYRWYEFEDAPLAPTPVEIVEKLETHQARSLLSSAEVLKGPRHHTLLTAAALMRSAGFVAPEIYAALDKLRKRFDLSDGRVISDKELSDIAEWVGSKEKGLVNIDAVVHGEQIAKSLAAGFSEAVEEVVRDIDIANPGHFPERLLKVPGVIGSMCEYINRTSIKRQPIFALGASLAAFGSLIGRKTETQTRGRSNLYCVAVGESGCGKDRARQAIKELLVAAGADALLGPEDLASEAGMLAVLVTQPAVLFQLDEIGHLLRAMTDPRAGTHLTGIVSAWLKLYSSSATVYKGKAYADTSRNPTIQQPNACVYGTTVPESLWQAMGAESVTNGLLARCLVFVTNEPDPRRQIPERNDPPAKLVETLRWWHLQGYGPSNMSATNPSPRMLHRNAGAEMLFAALDESVRAEKAKMGDNPLRALWTRTEQIADQLSLIYACSRDHLADTIDVEAATWGRDLSVYLTRRLIWECSLHVSENATEATAKRVLRIIQDCHEGITGRDLGRKTRWLKIRDREEILKSLLDVGDVRQFVKETSGRSAVMWEATAKGSSR